MSDTGWLILAVAAGVLAAFLWMKRERWVMRRRRRGRRGD
jgi:hypothetical protein